MIVRRATLFLMLFTLIAMSFLLPKILWLARSQITKGTMRFVPKNYSGQIVHSYLVISFRAGKDTIWFNSGDNIIFLEGETVPVRYERDQPSDARVNIFTDIWGDTLVYGAAPVLILLIMFLHPKGVPRNLKLRLDTKKPFVRII